MLWIFIVGHGVPKKFSEVKEAAFKRLIEKKESFKLREKLKERAQSKKLFYIFM